MFSIEQKLKKIDDFLNELKTEIELCKTYKNGKLICVIVTGSYAAYKLNPKLGNINLAGVPDVNIYGIVNEDNNGHLQVALDYANVLNKVAKKLDYNIMLDLHPFYKSYGSVDNNKFNLQITSRIINTNNINQYPISFWDGWQSCFYELCSNKKAYFNELKFSKFERNEKWLTDSFMALSSYNNAVHMAVTSGMYENKRHIYTEVYRYIKEVLKDGISIGVPLNQEYSFKIIKAWKSNLVNFYIKYYGIESEQIISKIQEIDNNYFKYLENCNIEELIELFSKLLDLVFNKGFCARRDEILKNDSSLFQTLPLWY